LKAAEPDLIRNGQLEAKISFGIPINDHRYLHGIETVLAQLQEIPAILGVMPRKTPMSIRDHSIETVPPSVLASFNKHSL